MKIRHIRPKIPPSDSVFALGPPILWLLLGLLAVVRTTSAEPIPFEQARALATNICSQCHLFPEPNLLDKTIWRDKVRPLMRTTMNLAAIENDPSPNSRILMK